ncbi:hypothetical protein ACFQRB_18395 [Halobaculum litoreum]|uniref:Histidine kinase-, DNA gyrase B-, and HSP90-like ATPase n=1 Tax=Halobaculum litoreum TaxID=3031998 RepID=A0ABD5XXF4_9EURY
MGATADASARRRRPSGRRHRRRGPPIPEIEIEAVDAGTDITDLQHGTGVGLFAMQWCAESLGGKLDITHREPRGNLVEFTLPTADPVDD